ncbi:MAG: type II toxin-antitoxin system prevent-host-death family antitoxin [Anaerolineales bacterium]
MTVEISYSEARRRLASLLDGVIEDKEVVIIRRRGKESAALISADELAGLTETVHLLRSPANADRLLSALARAIKDEGEPMTVDQLRDAAGIDD